MKELEKYLNSENEIERELATKLIQNETLFFDILKVCGNQFEIGSGSYLFDGKVYEYYYKMFEKQKLLFEKVKNCNTFLEIGTYMGHSLLISLLSNPNLDITCIDINDKYTKPSVELLNKKFNNNIKFIKGDSISILENLKGKFDLFHIDGAHSINYVTKEFEMCCNISSSEEINFLFDDYDSIKGIENIINKKYKIIEQKIPNCDWTNSFFKIKKHDGLL